LLRGSSRKADEDAAPVAPDVPYMGYTISTADWDAYDPAASYQLPRYIARKNKLVGGMLLTVSHKLPSTQCSARFRHLGAPCSAKDLMKRPIGADVVFKPQSHMYDPELKPDDFYNTSEGFGCSFGICMHPFNTYPSLPGMEFTYPVIIDSTLVGSRAIEVLNMIQTGMYLKDSWESVGVQAMTWNADTSHLISAKVSFERTLSGAISTNQETQALAVTNPYDIRLANVQDTMILLVAMILFVAYDVRNIWLWYKNLDKPSVCSLFEAPMILCNIMITGMQVLVFLLEIVYKHQLWSLKIHSSYRFYDSLYAEANFFMPPKVDSQSLSESTSGGASSSTPRWALQNDLTDTGHFLHDIQQLLDIGEMRKHFSLIVGLNSLFLLIRILYSVSFHQRLNFIADTLLRVDAELAHFAFVSIYAISCFSMTGHILFGDQSEHFRDIESSSNAIYTFVVAGAPDELEDLFQNLREQDGLLGLGAWLYFVCMLAWSLFVTSNIVYAMLGDAHVALLRSRPAKIQNLLMDLIQMRTEFQELHAGEKILSAMQRAYIEDLGSQNEDTNPATRRQYDARTATKQFSLLSNTLKRHPTKLYKQGFVLVQEDVQEMMGSNDRNSDVRRLQSFQRLPSSSTVREVHSKPLIYQQARMLTNQKMNLDGAEDLMDALKCYENAILEHLDRLEAPSFSQASSSQRKMSIVAVKQVIQRSLNEQHSAPTHTTKLRRTLQGQRLLKHSYETARRLAHQQFCMQEKLWATRAKLHAFLARNMAAYSRLHESNLPARALDPSSFATVASHHGSTWSWRMRLDAARHSEDAESLAALVKSEASRVVIGGGDKRKAHGEHPSPPVSSSHIDIMQTTQPPCSSANSSGQYLHHIIPDSSEMTVIMNNAFSPDSHAPGLERQSPPAPSRTESPTVEDEEPLSAEAVLEFNMRRLAKGKAIAMEPLPDAHDDSVSPSLQSHPIDYQKRKQSRTREPSASSSRTSRNQKSPSEISSPSHRYTKIAESPHVSANLDSYAHAHSHLSTGMSTPSTSWSESDSRSDAGPDAFRAPAALLSGNSSSSGRRSSSSANASTRIAGVNASISRASKLLDTASALVSSPEECGASSEPEECFQTSEFEDEVADRRPFSVSLDKQNTEQTASGVSNGNQSNQQPFSPEPAVNNHQTCYAKDRTSPITQDSQEQVKTARYLGYQELLQLTRPTSQMDYVQRGSSKGKCDMCLPEDYISRPSDTPVDMLQNPNAQRLTSHEIEVDRHHDLTGADAERSDTNSTSHDYRNDYALSTKVAELAICTLVKIKAYLSSEVALIVLVIYILLFLPVMMNKMHSEEIHESVSAIRSFMGAEEEMSDTADLAQWLGNLVEEVWDMQTCGDNVCDAPLEYKSFAHLGCTYDCGREEDLHSVVLVLQGDFSKSLMGDTHAATLMSTVLWNICWTNKARMESGLQEICWYEEDETLESKAYRVAETRRFTLPSGKWFVRITGDYYHLLHGQLYYEHPQDPTNLKQLSLDSVWQGCAVDVSTRSQYST